MAKKKNSQNRELEELDQAYQDLTGIDPKAGTRKKFPLIGLICVFAVLLVCAVGLCGYILYETGEVPQGITAAGMDLGGMTKTELREALGQNNYSRDDMVITVADTTITLSPEDTGAALDVDEALDAIWAAGRKGAAGQFDLLPYLNLDTDAVRRAVDQLGSKYNTNLTETAWTIEGDMPSLAYEDRDAPCQTLVITLGSPGYGLDTEALYQQVLDAYNQGVFRVEGSCTTVLPKPLDLEAIYDQTYTAPVDAVMDMTTFEVTPEAFGYSFDLERGNAMLSAAGYGDKVEIPFERISPEITYESLSGILYRDVLGSYSTPHTGNANRNTNLRLACQSINGVVLMPGELFSYNNTLGKRTAEKGYKPAPGYIGGKTVDTIGGGICQVSSTLYYSAILSDLDIAVRACHGFAPSYMPRGTDAMVSWGTQDFRFRNSTNYPIRIEAEVSGGYVNVKIIGTDERDYYVEFQTATNQVTDYKTVYETYPPDNPEGYKDGDVITTPYTGYEVVSYRAKYDKETGALISKDYEAKSVYRSRNQVICRIEEPTVPTEAETIPPETQPVETTDPTQATVPIP